MTIDPGVRTDVKVKRWVHEAPATLSDVVSALGKVAAVGSTSCWMFRGEAKTEWNGLEPMSDRVLGRGAKNRAHLVLRELFAIEEFRKDARVLLSDVEREMIDRSALDALAVLKHYGGAARLLDWSWSPYVAAFFAASEAMDSDGVIWAVSRKALERYGIGHEITAPGMTSGLIRCEEWMEAFDGKNGHVNVWQPTVRLPRMVRQQSDFSIVDTPRTSHFDALSAAVSEKERWALIIRADHKVPLLRYLEAMNITFFTLFPDLYGAARHVDVQAVSTANMLFQGSDVKGAIESRPDLAGTVKGSWYTRMSE